MEAYIMMEQVEVQQYRMKPNSVVSGVPWWNQSTVYRGRAGTGAVQTVQLFAPDGGDSLEVLRGSVSEVK